MLMTLLTRYLPIGVTTYIQNEQHYNDVLGKIPSVKESLWIGTADIKDLYVKVDNEATPFLGILAELIRRFFTLGQQMTY